jgi:hypothetical protein
MASLILNGSTSGSVTLSSPAVSGTTTLTLPANTGTVITTGSTFAGTGPAFSAYASASQTVTLATITKVAIDTENFDTNSNFDTTNNRFTPTVAGYYQVNGCFRGNAATTFTQIRAHIFKNGVEITRTQLAATLTNTTSAQLPVNAIVYMNGTSDYLELYGTVSGTGTATFNFLDIAATSQFSASLVRAA